jgi:hypothetical protein
LSSLAHLLLLLKISSQIDLGAVYGHPSAIGSLLPLPLLPSLINISLSVRKDAISVWRTKITTAGK